MAGFSGTRLGFVSVGLVGCEMLELGGGNIYVLEGVVGMRDCDREGRV